MIRPPPPPPPKDEVIVPPSSSAVVSSTAGPAKAVVPAPTPVVEPVGAQGLAPTSATEGGLQSAPTTNPINVPVTVAPAPEEPAEVEMDLDIPPQVMHFLLSDRYTASWESIKSRFNLTDDDAVFISDLDRMVMAGQLDLESYLVAIEDELSPKLKDDQLDQMYAQLLAERFVPLGDLLTPTAADVARSEALVLPQVPHYRIYTKPLTYSGAATEIAESVGFSIMGGPMRERLRELVMSKVKGIRVDVQVREMLTRGVDFGGLGLDPKAADKAVAALNDIIGRAKVMSEDEYANWLSAEARKKAEATDVPRTSYQVPGTKDDGRIPGVGSEDDAEIAKLQASMPKPVIDTSSELAKAVDMTLQRLPFKPSDEYLAKRLRNAVSSRLRDVRSSIEFKQILMRPDKVGGMGLESAQAQEVTDQVETNYKEFHDAIAKEEKGKIDTQLEEQKRKIEDRRHRETEEHAKWFEEKIRSRKAGESEQLQTAEAMRRLMTPLSPTDAKEARAETAKFGPLVPAAPTMATSAKEGGLPSAPTPPPPGTKVSEVAKPGIKVSPPTVEIAKATASSRPSLDAVKYAGPQLVGLVGELKSLNSAEFRRLAKDPQVAAQKILQKIDTLAQESFEKRVEGIRAFQGSPLQAAYMSLVAESFRTAKPVVAMAEEKRKAGADTLSPDEIAAVVKINSALHF